MKIKLWGVRGSIPTPGPTTVEFGGNTSCVSVHIGDGDPLIFDCGSGVRLLGLWLMGQGRPINSNIFISHTHWDHIQGFPFFVPSFIPGNRFRMYGPPSDIQDRSLKDIMDLQTNYEYFPISLSQLAADIEYIDAREGRIDVDGYQIETCKTNHPVSCLAYKVTHEGKTYIYGGDHEPYRNIYRDAAAGDEEIDEAVLAELDENAAKQNQRIVDFCTGADLVTWDSQYTLEEYEQGKVGWGHSAYEHNLDLCEKAGIKKMLLTHHDPLSPDERLRERETHYQTLAKDRGLDIAFAREGMEIEL